MDVHGQVASLLAEMRGSINNPEKLERLSDQIEVLTRAHMAPEVEPGEWKQYGLQPQQARLAAFLKARIGKTVSPQTALDALYFDRGGDEPSPAIIRVMVCNIRGKLKNSPYAIETVRGEGVRMVLKAAG